MYMRMRMQEACDAYYRRARGRPGAPPRIEIYPVPILELSRVPQGLFR